jgi:hypothetical protein
MHRQIDLKSLLSEILKTVQKNGKNVMKKYFKIFSKNSAFGKILRRPRHNFLQQSPIETRARVFFSTRCNVFMARNVRYWILLAQRQTKLRQTFILSRLKQLAL